MIEYILRNIFPAGAVYLCEHELVEFRITGMDKMESFFLSETLKYLYLIFDDKATKIDWQKKWVFTTEAHVIPVEG